VLISTLVNTRLQNRLLLGFLLALVVQSFAGVLLERNNAAFRSAQNHVAHGHEVTEPLQQSLASAEDAETGQRGCVLTGDDTYLKPYDAESKRARRYQRATTVAYLYVDNFKHVNDELGHTVGDELLKAIGKDSRPHCGKPIRPPG
jgi:CHASE3 domain sensor protein